MQLNKNTKTTFLFLAIILVFEVAVFFVAKDRPFWGDEGHFYETVKYFGNEISAETLQTYNEMSTPFPFISYAIWGKIFGFEVVKLRVFSIIIALFTYTLFYYLIFIVFKKSSLAFWSTLFLVVHPYMIGLSVFVFTDMMTILFLILLLISVVKKSSVLIFLSSAGAILSRQYAVFFPLALGIFYLIKYLKYKEHKPYLSILIPLFLSTFPTLWLFLLWKGFTPVNEVKSNYMHEAFAYHFDYLTLYISQIFIYMLPFVLFRFKQIYNNKSILITSLILSFFYWIFPVRACKIQTDVDVYTVGFFHKLINIVSGGNKFFNDLIFYSGFLLALPVVIKIVLNVYNSLKDKVYDQMLMLDFSIISFMIIMPFSYMHWEKYFLLIMPMMVMRFLLMEIKTEK